MIQFCLNVIYGERKFIKKKKSLDVKGSYPQEELSFSPASCWTEEVKRSSRVEAE